VLRWRHGHRRQPQASGVQATVPSVIAVALIAAVFAVVLATVDVDISGGLTSGDLLVGVGTLGLAWYTAQLASLTYLLDKHNVARERFRRDRQLRGVTRLVEKELEVVHHNAKAALTDGAWPAWYATPHGAWDRDGAIIAEAVSGEVAESLVVALSYVGEWEAIVTQYFLLHPEKSRMPNDEGSNKATLRELHDEIDSALQKLRGADALPSGAEDPDPDQEFAQRRYPQLRRVLFWPLA
jgi:hypothetical protein